MVETHTSRIMAEHKKLRLYMKAQIARLIAQHQGKVVTMKSASEEVALALTHYMAIDGEAWDEAPSLAALYGQQSPALWKDLFVSALPWYRERYSKYKFGLVIVPMESLIPLVMKSGDIPTDWPDFASYHKWYLGEGHMPDHDITKPLWPVILDGECGDEIFQDGWHRFHHYYRSGVKQVPCIYYL